MTSSLKITSAVGLVMMTIASTAIALRWGDALQLCASVSLVAGFRH